MKSRLTLMVCFLLTAELAGSAKNPQRAPILIVNSSVSMEAISRKDLRAIYLREKSRVGDYPLRPVLITSLADRTSFTRDVLGKSDTALRLYYRSLVFSGRSDLPVELDSEEKVIRYVGRTPNAIGYVGTSVSHEASDVAVRVISVQ